MAGNIKMKPELFYAYSLLGNKNISKGEKEINFANLNKGFYDELVSYDSSIRNNKEFLRKVKCDGMKESIYQNKAVPNSWRNKIGYYNDLYKTLREDEKFVQYLGQGKREPKRSSEDSSRIMQKPSQEGATSISFDNNRYQSKSFGMTNGIFDTPAITQKKSFNGKSGILTDTQEKQKKISSILEEYKTAFPLELKDNTLPQLNAINNKTTTSDNVIHFPSAMSKSEVFKSTIYSNLIPDKGNPLKQQFPCPHQKKLKDIRKTQYGPFLNVNYDFKNIEISNPKIRKNLIDLDYYGPYYSHCPSCRHKNLEFYETMEPNQCLKLLAQLKKMRIKPDTASNTNTTQ